MEFKASWLGHFSLAALQCAIEGIGKLDVPPHRLPVLFP
jgi:hypothetical protein